ncbi:hypothetical protein FRC03_007302 [Tulasnella sp. 419]|nr:hypothetical protein FRC02_006160 [Tulasnella sp. 418]KAG8938393.1 hypothetical protein FRC03_007302 [Tulasnella sp. 419]
MLFSNIAITLLAALSVTAYPRCRNPKVRKEWRDLTRWEKKEFIRAVKCLSKVPASPNFVATGWTGGIVGVKPVNERTIMDDFTYAHMDTNEKTHFTGLFLPWHRWFLKAFEDRLIQHCNFKGVYPYWDWSLDVADISKSPLFDPDPVYGLGTWGTAANNWTVTDGAFKDEVRAYPWPHVIQRTYSPQPFLEQVHFPLDFADPNKYANVTATPEQIEYILSSFVGDFAAFQGYMEGQRFQGIHNAMHLQFGPKSGDMGHPSHTPNDPIFYIHHNTFDRLWYLWQARNPANAQAMGGGTIKNLTLFDQYPVGLPPITTKEMMIPANGLTPEVPISATMSTTGGYHCYIYQEPRRRNNN